MAVRKKKAAKTAAKPSGRRAPAPRKSSAKKPAAKKAKPLLFAKAVASVAKMVAPAKKPAGREFGEGNYKASKRFRGQEEAFIRKNRSKMPALGKAAKEALDGPEGDDLRAAEAASAEGHT